MTTAAPNDETTAIYEKLVAASGAINPDALLNAFFDGHEAGKVDSDSGRSFLIRQKIAKPEWFSEDAAAALDAQKAAAATGTSQPAARKSNNPYELPESDPTRNDKIAAMIKSLGIKAAAGFAKSAECSPASGRKLRAA